MKSPLQGAQTSLFCCLAVLTQLKNGGYYANCSQQKVVEKAGWDAKMKHVWDFSEDATKEYLFNKID